MEIKNGIMRKTRLGVPCSDHGTLTFTIEIDYGGSAQCYGQLSLDEWNSSREKRIPTDRASGLLLCISGIWDKDWEDIPNTPCRVFVKHGLIRAVGHFMEDKWLYFDTLIANFSVVNFARLKSIEGFQ